MVSKKSEATEVVEQVTSSAQAVLGARHEQS